MNEKRLEGKIPVQIEKQSALFRNNNWPQEEIPGYIARTQIQPIAEIGMCANILTAYQQALHDNPNDLHGFMKEGCYYCIGRLPKNFCKKQYNIKTLENFVGE